MSNRQHVVVTQTQVLTKGYAVKLIVSALLPSYANSSQSEPTQVPPDPCEGDAGHDSRQVGPSEPFIGHSVTLLLHVHTRPAVAREA